MRRSPDGRGIFVKVVIAGAPHVGKLAILAAIAERYGVPRVEELTSGEMKTHRAAWSLAGRLAGGEALHVSLLTAAGEHLYNAAEELLLRDVDGVIFVIDVEPTRLKTAWEALLRVSDNMRRGGRELRDVTLALQYHRADRHRDFEPSKLDAWLGIPTGEVPRFVTSSRSPDLEGMAFDSVLGQIVRRIEAARSFS